MIVVRVVITRGLCEGEGPRGRVRMSVIFIGFDF